MLQPRAGFTLLEVLIALVVVTVGLIGLLGSLGPITRLGGEGKLRGRAALVLASRADLMRAELEAGAPGCVVPTAGSALHPDGVLESWSAHPAGHSVELAIIAGRDTLITRMSCP